MAQGLEIKGSNPGIEYLIAFAIYNSRELRIYNRELRIIGSLGTVFDVIGQT